MSTRQINVLAKCIVTCYCLLMTACATGERAHERPPNIVLVFIDDMGYGDIGPFGSTQNRTPHLDRMADQGIRLTNFYVSSTACTPSRSALMTGCYADRIGMDGRVNFPAGERGLNPDEITIAELLKSKGYVTGCFGKWHMGDQPGFMPLDQGFDEYIGIPYSNDMWTQKAGKGYPPLPLIKGDRPVAHISDGRSQALLCDVVTDAAVDFITRHKDEPFFAYVPHAYIHYPRFTDREKAEKADGNGTRAQIEEVDASVGRIMDTLKTLGIERNTLVMFTSDNGGSRGTSMGPLRGAKGGPKYEGHMRVPTLAWWPGRIPAGSVSHEIAATIDILPTFANLVGADVPTDRIIDGESVVPIIMGEPGAKSPHDVHFYEIEGVRSGKWKLVVKPKGKLELYNLETDFGERNDLSETFPDRVAELKGLIDDHAEELQKNRRPAAFVENPVPVLTSSTGVPTLAEYMDRTDLIAVEVQRPSKK